MLRIAFVDHPHHAKTRSSNFFVDALRRANNEVRLVHVSDSRDLAAAVSDVDLVVLWQQEHCAPLLSAWGTPHVVVPMFDGVASTPDAYWDVVGQAPILSFSLTLAQRLRRLGLETVEAKYFPDVPQTSVASVDRTAGFLWERDPKGWMSALTVNHLYGSSLDSLHVHLAPDGGSSTSKRELRQLPIDRVTWSRWSRDAGDYKEALTRSNVYFAPRVSEGIGLAFLEAMALGMCVIAADFPTHNEYITDGLTGYLLRLDYGNPQQLDVDAVRRIGGVARDYIADGRRRWLAQEVPALMDWLAEKSLQRPQAAGLERWGELVMRVGLTSHAALVDWLDGETLTRTSSIGQFSDSVSVVLRGRSGNDAVHRHGESGIAVNAGHNLLLRMRCHGEGGNGSLLGLRATRGAVMVRQDQAATANEDKAPVELQKDQEAWFFATGDELSFEVESVSESAVIEIVAAESAGSVHPRIIRTVGSALMNSAIDVSLRELVVHAWMEGALGALLPTQLSPQQVHDLIVWLFTDGAGRIPDWASGGTPALANLSWACRTEMGDGLLWSVAYGAASAWRRSMDPHFAAAFPEDTDECLAWYYMCGVGEMGLVRMLGADELDWLFGPAGGGATENASAVAADALTRLWLARAGELEITPAWRESGLWAWAEASAASGAINSRISESAL